MPRVPRREFALGALVLLLAAVGSACGVGDARTRTLGPSHHHVLLVGDSLMGNTATRLPEQVRDAGWDVTFVDAHQNGTGVLGPVGDQPDALSYVKAQIAAHPEVDTVVIEWAGACATCGAGAPVYGSEEFYAAWRAGAHAIIDYLHSARGPGGNPLDVAWVRSPPMPTVEETAQYQLKAAVALVLSWIDAAELGPAAGPTTPDWFEALADTDAHYRQNLIYDGATHQVRADDLVHLTPDGAARTAQWTAVGLTEMWSRSHHR